MLPDTYFQIKTYYSEAWYEGRCTMYVLRELFKQANQVVMLSIVYNLNIDLWVQGGKKAKKSNQIPMSEVCTRKVFLHENNKKKIKRDFSYLNMYQWFTLSHVLPSAKHVFMTSKLPYRRPINRVHGSVVCSQIVGMSFTRNSCKQTLGDHSTTRPSSWQYSKECKEKRIPHYHGCSDTPALLCVCVGLT